ncbi:LANO_0C01376g1_1 [Lachancea nothofagi CBS 11611]|uniref:LANO_0C01376g1_1 n=1 Tax=Lachancea nothofagi CBS 11611 TaxID=1266666 RepID=A0A1G4J4A2_9SACH|nr:LANO_0C01376g1_1 [Lachancea nothofagi CBS 11611]
MNLTPETPLHTGADEELNIDEVNELDDSDVQGLNLESEADTNGSSSIANDGQDLGMKRENSGDEDMGYDQRDDYVPRVNIGSPFSSNVDVARHFNADHVNQRRLSLAQQSKFIAYCDEKLMAIQRKFVQSRGLTEENGYRGLAPLLDDLKAVLDFVWYSVEGMSNTENLLGTDLDAMSANQFSGTKSTNIGQMYYLMQIADTFLEYLTKFDLGTLSAEEQHRTLSKAFKFLMILDKVFARSLEGLIPGNTIMNGTEMVRIAGIAERTRMTLTSFLEEQGVHGYHYEVSKIYEETLERCA